MKKSPALKNKALTGGRRRTRTMISSLSQLAKLKRLRSSSLILKKLRLSKLVTLMTRLLKSRSRWRSCRRRRPSSSRRPRRRRRKLRRPLPLSRRKSQSLPIKKVS